MDQRGNRGEKRNTEEKTNVAEDRLRCRNSVCAAVTASLTLLALPGQHYQNTSSNCKQKKNYCDAWSEDVLNHVQAARKKFLFSHLSSEADSGGTTQGAAVGDRVCLGRKGSRPGGG